MHKRRILIVNFKAEELAKNVFDEFLHRGIGYCMQIRAGIGGGGKGYAVLVGCRLRIDTLMHLLQL